MIARMRAILLCLAALTAIAAAQDRDAGPPQKQPAGTIKGRVIAADTGRPIGRATVTATPAGTTSAPALATTNDDGTFRFGPLTPGRYVIIAEKPGAFVAGQYGQPKPDLPGQVVRVQANAESAIDIALTRAAVISGRVVDETGDPLPLASVFVAPPPGSLPRVNVPVLNMGDGRVWSSRDTNVIALDATNDRGEFRIFGLLPGEYILFATMPSRRGDTSRPVPIYFPGVTDPAQAMRLTAEAGHELSEINFTARRVPTVRVSGFIATPDGGPASRVSVTLHVDQPDGNEMVAQIAMTGDDGAFSFEASPGQYIVRARKPHIPPPDSSVAMADLSGSQPLWVGEADISGVFMKLTYGATLRGRFVFEGTRRPANKDRFRVQVQSGSPGAVVGARPNADDSFVVRGIESGQRRVFVAAGEPEWVAKSVVLNGQDLMDRPIDFREEATVGELVITFTNVRPSLAIELEPSNDVVSATVAVFRADPARWHPGAASAIVAADGLDAPITIQTLPAGDYLVVALANVAARTLNLRDNKVLEMLKPLAHDVRLVEGAPVTVRLKPVTLRR
jgi:protocatechuate 3,4-dioxygenase beta subunit